jgi:predicted  nucleic acid-binding Zn-ribbon protein
MAAEFANRLDAELESIKARIEEQKRLVKKAGDIELEKASANLRELLVCFERLEETRRKIEEQSHGG